MSMSLEVFAPSLVKCMKDMSERHCDKILYEKTGKYKFQSVPTIEQATWKSVQKSGASSWLGWSTAKLHACSGST